MFRAAKIMFFAIGILLVQPSWAIAEELERFDGDPQIDGWSEDRTFISMGGTEVGEDIASLTYVGQLVNRSGGAFGAYSWIGDINGDSINDTAISAIQTFGESGHDEDGAVFIFFGKVGDPSTGTIDLQSAEPDMRIYANTPPDYRAGRILTSQMTAGDYNGDGRTDIALHSQRPFTSKTTIWPNPIKNRCIILFAPESGMPSKITLPDDELMLRAKELDYCGPVGTAADTPMPYFMETRDIDGDGIDDLVFGGCYNSFPSPRVWRTSIVWGGYSGAGHDPNLTFTNIVGDDDSSGFGSSIDLGDIDGDHGLDLVVGSPSKTPDATGLYESGAARIYFNISSWKGVPEVPYNVSGSKVIYGNDAYDKLGQCVMLRDIDGDGRDDILASAPEADGPDNADDDCGEIGVLYGGPAGSFPSQMSFEKDYDLMILGPTGRSEEGGFKLGQMFRIGDLTGDGRPDLASGLMGKDLPPLEGENTIRFDCGIAAIYEHESIFRNPTGMVRVGYPAKTFTIEGKDVEDMFGYYFSIADLDGNGIDDILVSAPYADGPGNARPRCGEVYLVYSSHLRLWDQTFSGPCYDDGTVYASQGPLRIETVVINERPEIEITDVRLALGPEEGPIAFDCSSGGIVLTDPYDCVDEGGISISMPQRSRMASFIISFDIGWFFPIMDDIDIWISLTDAEGCVLKRHYRDVFEVAKDLSFKEVPLMYSNGSMVPGRGSWLGMGAPIEIGFAPIVYRGHTDREVEEDGMDIIVRSSAGTHRVPYSSDWSFPDSTREAPLQNYSFSIGLRGDPVPPDPRSMPRMDKDIVVSVKVDDRAPLAPSVALVPPNDASGDIGQPGPWRLEIGGNLGERGDPGGSGVRYFMVTDSNGPFIAQERGGLWGSYFADTEFCDLALNLTDPMVDFEWGMWGPHPETSTMPPSGFSAIWHGWICVDSDTSVRFQLAGRGRGMMVLDGSVHIPFDDLEYAPKGMVLDLLQNVRHEVVLYYKHVGTNETPSFRFQWIDPEGSLSPVPGSALLYPSTSTNVSITLDVPEVQVRAFDWVGLVSGAALHLAEIDPDPPVFDTTGVPRWTRTPDIAIALSITDEGSGIDLDTVRYRTLRRGEQFGTWTTDGISLTTFEEDLSVVNMTAMIALERDFSGTIEFTSSDRAGNIGRTPPLPIDHDRTPPAISIMGPPPGSVLRKDVLELSAILTDANGSGVDPSSVVLRYRLNDLGWNDLPSSGDGPVQELRCSFDIAVINGTIGLMMTAGDAVGNNASIEFNFTVEILPRNTPPVARIGDPANGSRFLDGWPLILDATGTRDDGLGLYDPVKLNWYSNISGFLGNGMSIKVNLKVGIHLITLYADDGEFNVSASVVVTVVERFEGGDGGGGGEPDGGSDLGIVLGAFITIVLVAVVIAVLVMRHRYQYADRPEE